MKRLLLLVHISTVLLILSAQDVSASWPWKLPKLPSFGSKEESSRKNERSVKKPHFPLAITSKRYGSSTSGSKSLSMMKKFSANTKQFYSKAKDTLTPWKKSNPQPTRYGIKMNHKEKKTWIPNWMRSKKPSPQKKSPQTISDWMKLDRPG